MKNENANTATSSNIDLSLAKWIWEGGAVQFAGAARRLKHSRTGNDILLQLEEEVALREGRLYEGPRAFITSEGAIELEVKLDRWGTGYLTYVK